MAHAYVIEGDVEEGVGRAFDFALESFGIKETDPDLVLLRHGLFSVEDARALSDIAIASPIGHHKVVVVSATRLFHEAQNALLKLFEEPPPSVTMILIVPTMGILLPTLRSRLAALPKGRLGTTGSFSKIGETFIRASTAEREKIFSGLIDRSRSDNDKEKQAARSDAVRLAEDLLKATASLNESGSSSPELRDFMEDLISFLPLLHTRSAPLKLIFEHLLLVIPKGLKGALV
jgi:DNA polymerase III delta prime subunit